MLKVDNEWVGNFEGAFRGMRNPMNSWEQSDSLWNDGLNSLPHFDKSGFLEEIHETKEGYIPIFRGRPIYKYSGQLFSIGPKDLQLAQKLILAGSDHSKFMRQIMVSCDIDAPLYFWKEMDTYAVGVVKNSCSTMHKLATTPITRECFSFDEELDELTNGEYWLSDNFKDMINQMVHNCESLRQLYLETKDVRYWRALIQLLPSSWNQKRTWTANYAVLRNIYHARKNHKLSEWHQFCDWIETLPYAKELIMI